jgi:predicted CoA-binding protein
MHTNKKTLVLGASDHPSRYSFLAMQRLQAKDHPVVAIGKRKAKVGNILIETTKQDWQDIDTVTIYLNPQNQKDYYDYILSLHPSRVIFNPGAENPELEALCKQHNINPVEACTLVLLSTGQY